MKLKKLVLSFISLIISLSVTAVTPTVDDRGNVVFNTTVEGLPLSASEIHKSALEYLENAYKDTSYDIVENDSQKGCVTGKGSFMSLHQQGGLVKSQIYSVTFHVRIDSKDGRARIRFFTHDYDVKGLSDFGDNEVKNLAIADCEPLGKTFTGKGHKNAFVKLQALAEKTLAAVEAAIRSTSPSLTSSSKDEDW